MECVRWGFKPSPVHPDFPAIKTIYFLPWSQRRFLTATERGVQTGIREVIFRAALRVSRPSVLQLSCRITVRFLHLPPLRLRGNHSSRTLPAAEKRVQIESLLWFNGVEFTQVASPFVAFILFAAQQNGLFFSCLKRQFSHSWLRLLCGIRGGSVF